MVFLLAGCIAPAHAPVVMEGIPVANETSHDEGPVTPGAFFSGIHWSPEFPEYPQFTLSTRTALPEGPPANNFDCIAFEHPTAFDRGGFLWEHPLEESSDGRWQCIVPVVENVHGIVFALNAKLDDGWTSTDFFVIPTKAGRDSIRPTPVVEDFHVATDSSTFFFSAHLGLPNIDDTFPVKVIVDYCTFASNGGSYCSTKTLTKTGPSSFEGHAQVDRNAMMGDELGRPTGTILLIAIAEAVSVAGGQNFSSPQRLTLPG